MWPFKRKRIDLVALVERYLTPDGTPKLDYFPYAKPPDYEWFMEQYGELWRLGWRLVRDGGKRR